jgi:hypothetical protein
MQEGAEKHKPCLGQLTKLVVQMAEEGVSSEPKAVEGGAPSLQRYGNEDAKEPSPFHTGLVYPTVVPTAVGFDLVSVLREPLSAETAAEVRYIVRPASSDGEAATRPSAAEVVESMERSSLIHSPIRRKRTTYDS